MRNSRTARILALPIIIGLALSSPLSAFEADLPWDQASATQLADDLSQGVDGIFAQAKLEQRGDEGAKSADNYLLIEDLRSLRRYIRQLHRRLKEGQGQAETAAFFQRIERLVRDAAVARRSSTLLSGAQAEIDSARKLLDGLTAYYRKTTPPVASE